MNIYKNKDLKIIKNKGLIQKVPNSPIGYYKLAQTYLAIGNFKDAIAIFKQALGVDKRCIKAAIGLIVSYIYIGKYRSAAREYQLYRDSINSKTIYKKYLCKMLNKYLLLCPDNERINVTNIIRYYFGYKKVEDIFKAEEDDIFSIIILTDGIVSGKNKNLKVSQELVLKKCAVIKWITNEYRWNLLHLLSENISNEERQDIMRIFDSIPQNCSDPIVINDILESIILQNNINMMLRAFNGIKDKRIISSTNLWSYINYCKDCKDISDDLLTTCGLLINRGWIDSIVANCVYGLKNKGLLKDSSNEIKILNLYGFKQ